MEEWAQPHTLSQTLTCLEATNPLPKLCHMRAVPMLGLGTGMFSPTCRGEQFK